MNLLSGFHSPGSVLERSVGYWGMMNLEGYFPGDIDIEEMNFTMDSDKLTCGGDSFAFN